MAKIYTPFMTKRTEKPYPLTAHTYIAHIREYPPGRRSNRLLEQRWRVTKSTITITLRVQVFFRMIVDQVIRDPGGEGSYF